VGIAAVRLTGDADRADRLEAWLVVLVALHSIAVGLILLLAPAFTLRFGGWDAAAGGTLFFVRQGGAFHLAIATGYLLEWTRRRSVTLLCATKALATVFLGAMALAEPGPWAVPFSAAGDAAMGLAVALLHHRGRRAR
jgi:hypothetical protein